MNGAASALIRVLNRTHPSAGCAFPYSLGVPSHASPGSGRRERRPPDVAGGRLSLRPEPGEACEGTPKLYGNAQPALGWVRLRTLMSALAAPFIGDHYRVTAPATVSHPVPGPETFESIVDDYQRRLYGFALRMTGNREDAEEIVQDAFVRAYRALAKMDPQ